MRDYSAETTGRVGFIKELLQNSGKSGIVFGNSGGKDSALAGILCKLACDNTLGMIMPCGSRRNYDEDMKDAAKVALKFGIETRTVDLGLAYNTMLEALAPAAAIEGAAVTNIAPRLRMAALYAVGAAEDRLVAGTGNRSEIHMGYFTKWGDGGCDFNPIADLTVTEVYEFLEHLGAPRAIIDKAPSAGLFDGQTDESDMGISYESIDRFLLGGECSADDLRIITRYHNSSEHKRRMPIVYSITSGA
ncbi:MAG: NAD(+) synthase [Oscillospiraceae bacterium]|nr:NAD(+) synthase [Oscillospiraceae bacterium]